MMPFEERLAFPLALPDLLCIKAPWRVVVGVVMVGVLSFALVSVSFILKYAPPSSPKAAAR